MRTSDSIAQIAEALAKAQGEIDDATRGQTNTFYKSRYADLAAVRSVIREPLAVNDIAVVQLPRTIENMVEVETMLVHKSGEFISESLRLPVGKWDAHGIASAITYSRRIGLMALLGIATDDDDGNAAVEKTTVTMVGGGGSGKSLKKDEAEKLISAAREAASKGEKELSRYWAHLSQDERDVFDVEARKELKKIATEADQKEAA